MAKQNVAKGLFDSAEDPAEVLGMMVGAGSMCWENPEGAGVFDSRRAQKIVEDGAARLQELLAENCRRCGGSGRGDQGHGCAHGFAVQR